MKLDDKQIQLVNIGITKFGVTMHDLQNDLLDHICCSIEDKMQKGMDFKQSYLDSFREFGLGGLRIVQINTEKEISTRNTLFNFFSSTLNYFMNFLYLIGSIVFIFLPFVFGTFANDIRVIIYFSPFTFFGIYLLINGINYRKFQLNYLY